MIREAEELSIHRSGYYKREIVILRIVVEGAVLPRINVMRFYASQVPNLRDSQQLENYLYDMITKECIQGGQLLYVISIAADAFMHRLLCEIPTKIPVHVMCRSRTISLIYAKK